MDTNATRNMPDRNAAAHDMFVGWGMPADCWFLRVARGEATLAEWLAAEPSPTREDRP